MDLDNTFGQRVRQRRRSLDLTQEELARRVGCAAITLRKIEAGDARPSQQIAERLAMALAIPLDERADFVRQARAVQPGDRGVEPTFTPQVVPEEIGLEDLSGRAIRSYTLHEKIGAGAFGVVYRAVQPLVEREVAIKIILPQYANHPDFIRRFEAEAQLVARLEHPHIVPLYDYWRDPGVAYLVMRLLRGGSAQNLLERGPLALETVARLIDQIGAALHTAHRAGVVHRDLKPSNVLLDEDGNAYLADFGIAKNLGNPETQTQAGMVIGSPAYMSPEQINADPVHPQADIYSLGVMLYELLTGARPFLGPTPIELIQQHLFTPLPPLAANRQGLPAVLDEVIARATAKDPAQRYPEVPLLLADLQEVLRSGRVFSSPIEWASAPWAATGGPACGELVNPYKGLRAFEEADAPDFFGREALTQQLLTRLGEGGDLARFLAVIGPSGSGKSSVVGAGLVPALRRGALLGSENWFVVELVPGPHPLEELEAALLRVAVNPPESLLSQLREDKRGLLRAVNRTLPKDEDVELVLVIDQFEELFTLVDDEAERAHLLDSLVEAVLAERSRVRVIVTLRADFIDRPLRYVDFGELVQRRAELVLPLTPDEMERAIVGPAQRVGLRFEAGLAEEMIGDVSDQPGALPLLQYALTELVEVETLHATSLLTKAAYQSIGGVRGALGRRAEEVFAALDEAGQVAAQQMFLRLVTLGEGTEDVRRRVLRAEVESLATTLTPGLSPYKGEGSAGQGDGEMGAVLDAFGKARLLTFDRDLQTRGPTVEVAHEALLREWPRLREWLTANRQDVRLQRLLAAATAEWLNADRDASYLLQGARLAQFESWFATTPIALTHDERTFLEASIAERKVREAVEAARRAHEAKLERRAKRVLQGLVAVAIIAAIISGTLALVAANRAQEAQVQQQAALLQKQEAEANFTRAEAQRLAGEANNLLLSGGNAEQAALLSLRSMNLQYAPQSDIALTNASRLNYPRQIFLLNDGWAYSVAFSPDGRYVLAGGDQTAHLLDTQTGQQIRALGANFHNWSVAFSPDGRQVLTGNDDNSANLWDVETGQIQRIFTTTSAVLNVAFSSDGKTIMGVTGAIVYLWDTRTGELLRQFSVPGAEQAALSPDGRYFATTVHDGPARLWDAQTGQQVRAFGQYLGSYGAAFSPDGKYLVVGTWLKVPHLWNVETGEEVHALAGHTTTVGAVAFSPDGRYVLTGSDDRTARLWDVQSGETMQIVKGHTEPIESVAFSPDGKSFATASADGSIRLWNVNPTTEPPELIGHTDWVYDAAFSPDGKYALTAGGDGTARLWDAHTGQPVRTLVGHAGPVLGAAFTPDSQSALTSAWDGTVRVWSVKTGEEVRRLPSLDSGAANDVAVSPDGKYALVGYSFVAAVWDLSTGKLLDKLPNLNGVVGAVAISPDGKYALTGNWWSYVVLWTFPQPHETFRIEYASGLLGPVRSVAFSPDGKSMLTSSQDRTAARWDTQTGKVLRRYIGHTASVNSVDISSDGKLVATGSADGTARIWDAETGQEIRRFNTYAIVFTVKFSPDGKYLLIGDNNGDARLWDVDYHTTMQYLCSRLLRDLTYDEKKQYGITDNVPTCSKQPAAGAKPYIPVISRGSPQGTFWQAVRQGADQAAREFNVDTTFEGPDTDDATAQLELFQAAIDKHPAAICFAAIDRQAAIPLLEKARAANIPVIGLDSGVDSDIPAATVATDNVAAAAAAADKMAQLIGGSGEVAIIAHDQTSRTGRDRVKGFTDQIKTKYPNITIVDTQYGGGVPSISANLARTIIQAYPNLKGIFSANEPSAMGVLDAVQALNVGGKLVIIGYDAGRQQKDAIRSGLEAGAITQDPINMGYQCIETAVKASRGESLPKNIDTGFKWYDKTNIDDPAIAPLLYD